MLSVLLIVQLIIAVALIITVLLQRSEGGALGIGGSGSGLGGLFSPRGAANTLTQTTAFLAAAFFIISVVLNILTLHGMQNRSILDTTPTGQHINLPVRPAPLPAKPQKAPAPQVPTVPPSH
jgi:preprotein translocase subunit SecG